MNTPFEHTVVEYLDGRLTPKQELAFLEAVAGDARKRMLLEQHQSLRAALRDRQHPQAVPLTVQRALAEKIPSLEQMLPAGIQSSGGAAGFFHAAGKLLLSINLKRIWLPLLTAASLVTVTLGVAYISSPDAPHPVGIVEREQQARLGSAADDREINEARNPSGADAGQSGSGFVEHVGGRKPIRRGSGRVPDAPSAMDNAGGGANEASGDMKRGAHNPGARASSRNDEEFLQGTSPRPIVQLGDGSNPDGYGGRLPQLHSANYRLFNGPLILCLETGAGRFDAQGSGSNRASDVNGLYMAALRYEFTPHLSIGIEAGQSHVTRETMVAERVPLTAGSGTDVIIIDRGMTTSLLPWLRFGGQYTLNPDARLQFQFDAGGGIFLTGEHTLVFSTGLTSAYILSPNLMLRLGLHYTGSRMAPSQATISDPLPSQGVIGIIRRNSTAGYSYSSSIDFRIGVGVRVW